VTRVEIPHLAFGSLQHFAVDSSIVRFEARTAIAAMASQPERQGNDRRQRHE